MRTGAVVALAIAAALLVPARAGAQPKPAPRPQGEPAPKSQSEPAPKSQGEPAPKPQGAAPAPSKPREERGQPVTVSADQMERYGKESLIILTGKVVARQDGSVQHADRMEVYLDEKGDRILRTVSTGNVRIVTRDCRIGTSRRAEYYDLEQRMVRQRVGDRLDLPGVEGCGIDDLDARIHTPPCSGQDFALGISDDSQRWRREAGGGGGGDRGGSGRGVS